MRFEPTDRIVTIPGVRQVDGEGLAIVDGDNLLVAYAKYRPLTIKKNYEFDWVRVDRR